MALKFDEINISDGEWNATGLGIGTTSPATRLEVSSEGAHGILLSKDMTTPSNSGRLFFETDTVAEGWSFLNSNGLMTIRSGAQAGGTSGSVKMAMNTAGSVGIGTTTPSAKLHVNSSSDFLGYFKSTDNKVYVGIADNDTTFYISAENSLASIGPYTGLHVDNLNYDLVNKRLGIGTTSPSAKLDVVGTYKLNGQRGLSVRSIDESNYFSFNDESTAADFTQQLPKTGGSGTVTKVDDSTAPAEGCFEVTGNYYSDIHTDNRYVKVDINAEYTWEMYVKFVSGTDTSQTIYLGWGAWDANKTYFGNTQRYWGASAAQVDADSNNSDWVLIRGTISGVGTGNGKFIAGTEYVAPVVLLNYNSNANVIRVCGLKLYKSSKSATKIQLGRSGASSSAVFNVNTEYPASRVTLENSGADGMRVRNDHGYLEIGSLNSGHAHIQTDRTNFYFNKRILVDEGIISSYNEDLTLQTSQATRLVIKSDTGNVGINTTSPQAKLDVEPGDVGTNSGDSVTAAIIRAGRQNVHFLTERTASGSDWNNNTFKILAKIDSTSHQSINFVNDVSYNEHIDIYTGNQLFSTRFNANGNVGIGTTNPSSTLQVGDGSTNASIRAYYNDGNYTEVLGYGIQMSRSYSYIRPTADGTQSLFIGTSAARWAVVETHATVTTFNTNGTENMRIDSSGNVGIGTTSPATNAKLTIAGNQTFGLPGNGTNTSGRFLSIEGNADSAGEGSSRIFFTEHNSSTAGMDKYGVSLGYRGGSTSITGASGNSWTGLSQINNGEWGLFGHNDNAAGRVIMKGSRTGTSIDFNTNLLHNTQGVNITAGNAYGIRFWGGSTSYSIYMSSAGTARLDDTSDYNMYFKMAGGNNRGFVFMNDSTPVAQIDSAGHVRATGLVYSKLYKTTTASIANSYVRIAEIDDTSGQLSSIVRVTMTAHGNGHVTTCNAIISVGHSQDILIQSSSLDYTQVVLKVESNSNGRWTLSAKSTSANTATYRIDIQGLSNGLTITPNPTTSQTGTVLEHQTNYGTNVTATGGNQLRSIFGGAVTAVDGITRQSGGSTTAGIKFWSGTKAQYDALTADANTIYYITDE